MKLEESPYWQAWHSGKKHRHNAVPMKRSPGRRVMDKPPDLKYVICTQNGTNESDMVGWVIVPFVMSIWPLDSK